MPHHPVIERVYVWDKLVRLHHWSVASLILINGWLLDGGGKLHRWAGYTLVALICTRIVWGLLSHGYARFSTFLPTPSRIKTYRLHYQNNNLPMPTGHNPLGGMMILLMFTLILSLGITGWLMGTDTYWGVTWLENLHETLFYILMLCVSLHVTMVLVLSKHLRINLPKAMVTGYKERTTASRPLGSIHKKK
jgi:cytochrome b